MSNTDEGVNYEKIKRIRLISNCFGYGPWPEPATEVEQHLTITSGGYCMVGFGFLSIALTMGSGISVLARSGYISLQMQLAR